MFRGFNPFLCLVLVAGLLSFSSFKDDYDYATDWRSFKAVIVSKDEGEVSKYCTDNIIDYGKLFKDLNTPFVRRAIDETSYEKLTESNRPKRGTLLFYTEDIGIDKFGTAYKMSISLFFFRTSEGLRLDNYKFVE